MLVLGSEVSALAGLKIFGLAFAWVVASYLFGRYSGREPLSLGAIWKDLAALLAVVAVSLLLLLGLCLEAEADLGSGVLARVFAGIGLLSFLAWLCIRFWDASPQHWLLVVSDDERCCVLRELNSLVPSRAVRVKVISSEELVRRLNDPFRDVWIAVGDAVQLDQVSVNRLLSQRSNGVRIHTLVHWAELELRRVPSELLTKRWMLASEGFNVHPGRFGWRLKRFGDVFGAALLLLGLSPVLALAAGLVRLGDGGPVLYSQIRTGLYGTPFRIWKLRTMCVEDQGEMPRWAVDGDHRITRVGAVLRALRIDELPQLIGVLRGDLSLVGPRPEQPAIDRILESSIDHYPIRYWSRPGLTGWAQVNDGYVSSVDEARQKLAYDIYYLRNGNMLLDMLILLKTIRVVLLAKGR